MLTVEQKGEAMRAAWDGIYQRASNDKAGCGGLGFDRAGGSSTSECGESATQGPLGDAIDEHFRMHAWNFGEPPGGLHTAPR